MDLTHTGGLHQVDQTVGAHGPGRDHGRPTTGHQPGDHRGAVGRGLGGPAGQDVAHTEPLQVPVGLHGVAALVEGPVEGDRGAIGHIDQQAHEAAVNGAVLGQGTDDEAQVHGRRQRGAPPARGLGAGELGHLQGQGGDAPHIGDHGPALIGVVDEGPAPGADEDPQAEGGCGLGLVGPVGAGLGAALLDLLGGGEDGGLNGADRGGGAGGGEVRAQLGSVGPGSGGDPHALDVLDAGLQDDVVGVTPGGDGSGDRVLAQRRC